MTHYSDPLGGITLSQARPRLIPHLMQVVMYLGSPLSGLFGSLFSSLLRRTYFLGILTYLGAVARRIERVRRRI